MYYFFVLYAQYIENMVYSYFFVNITCSIAESRFLFSGTSPSPCVLGIKFRPGILRNDGIACVKEPNTGIPPPAQSALIFANTSKNKKTIRVKKAIKTKSFSIKL